MDSIPDSSGFPVTGTGRPGRKITWLDIKQAINRSVAESIGEAFRISGQSDERTQARIRDLETQIQALRQEIVTSNQKLTALNAAYSEYREWGEQVAASVAHAEGDAKTIERTMGRVDGLVEIAQLLLVVLEPTSRGINWVIDKLHSLTPRKYSRVDKQEITELINRPRRRASDRR